MNLEYVFGGMMKTLVAITAASALMGMPAFAADMAIKAPPMAAAAPAPNWSGFYVFGGGGAGLWAANSNVVDTFNSTAFTRDQRLGGSGWFGTVGAGYDQQFGSRWVAGVFADAQFGDIAGSIANPESFDPFLFVPDAVEGRERLRASYAAGVRLGYLIAPNVLSYVNAGYSGSQWSGANYSLPYVGGGPNPTVSTTPSFRRDGWFVGGGVENSLNLFGVSASGWFMKTEYRAAYYDRIGLPEARVVPSLFGPAGTPTGFAVVFKPLAQTISTSLVYRFNSEGSAAAAPLYTKAPASMPANWNGFHVFGGGGGGAWAADSNSLAFPDLSANTRDQRFAGRGWFGTVGLGYDWQLRSNWVMGVLADGQFGDISGSIVDSAWYGGGNESREKLRTSYAAGARLGYLVAPNVLSYVNAGYSASEWSGANYSTLFSGSSRVLFTTPSFHRDGWFVGGGVENSLNVFGIEAPGWFMKTEYRATYYDRLSLPETSSGTWAVAGPAGTTDNVMTFKSWTQTVSASLVYRFNWMAPVTAKY